MLKLSTKLTSVLLALIFVIPATGLSISKHSCMDCDDVHLSLIYHHQAEHNDCNHNEPEKSDKQDWHLHFFDKHHHHKKECKYEDIKLSAPYKGTSNLVELAPLEYNNIELYKKPTFSFSINPIITFSYREEIKIPGKLILIAYCSFLI